MRSNRGWRKSIEFGLTLSKPSTPLRQDADLSARGRRRRIAHRWGLRPTAPKYPATRWRASPYRASIRIARRVQMVRKNRKRRGRPRFYASPVDAAHFCTKDAGEMTAAEERTSRGDDDMDPTDAFAHPERPELSGPHQGAQRFWLDARDPHAGRLLRLHRHRRVRPVPDRAKGQRLDHRRHHYGGGADPPVDPADRDLRVARQHPLRFVNPRHRRPRDREPPYDPPHA